MTNIISRIMMLLALLLALALAWLALTKEGGCDRDPDEDPRPAGCKPGDTKCMAADQKSTQIGVP